MMALSTRSEQPTRSDCAPPPTIQWRREYKYNVPAYLYHPLITDIRAMMRPDRYGNDANKYTVRSLYFDTIDYQRYHEKLTGEPIRAKPRIRIYPQHQTSMVKFEIKHRRYSHIGKDVVRVDRSAYERIIADLNLCRWPRCDMASIEPGVIRFWSFVRLGGMKPTINVQYMREAFVSSRLRVTLDQDLIAWRARNIDQSYRGIPRRLIPHKDGILEIKIGNAMPYWLNRVVRKHGLQLQSFSKYEQAISRIVL